MKELDLLQEITYSDFTSKASAWFSKLSDKDVIALRSWVVWPTDAGVEMFKERGEKYISGKKAALYLSKSDNIRNVSRSFIKSIWGNEPLTVYRSYDADHPALGLKSYSVSSKAARMFGAGGPGNFDKRKITYKDVVAVPAISFKGWKSSKDYAVEMEIVINL